MLLKPKYRSLQRAFFYDAIGGNLEGQIVSVVNNEKEFHSDLTTMIQTVSSNSEYVAAFDSIYRGGINDYNVRNAIATYVASLTPFNSKFDRNINGIENSLTTEEIEGFNLFSGKAQCATCHFTPLFNGLVPTKFAESEMELIGVPKTKDTINPEIDPDPGRYNLYGTEQKRFFFKTPTVRNVAMTAPYMHNGVYETLEEVIDFYNKGGGVGLGLDLEYQTLPSEPLGLSKEEISALVAFMETLTDQIATK